MIGRATANINRILLSVVTEIDLSEPVDEAVRAYLSMGRKYYASDNELRAGVATVRYYLNGRPQQRALVLQWLEVSYNNKEPVDPETLTIEHVLPQTLTAGWNAALQADLNAEENLDVVYESLVHTLGNLTLTGYNSELSNGEFAAKRTKLAASGVAMNQEIAQLDQWGRSEILGRAARLAERAISVWPGPDSRRTQPSPSSTRDGTLLSQALAELPAGAWTSYGDVAALIGSHPVPVGSRLANHPIPNAHRVLQVEGTISPGFRWPDAAPSDPMELLREEGVTFDEHGRANPNQRMTTAELAQLVTIETDEPTHSRSTSADGQREKKLFVQLSKFQSAAVVDGVRRVVAAWVALGGFLAFGNGDETSCFLMSTNGEGARPDIWPLTIYPGGRCEVVFQHLARRPPFDDAQLREQLLLRLNTIEGVDLPPAKIELRPSLFLQHLPAMLPVSRASRPPARSRSGERALSAGRGFNRFFDRGVATDQLQSAPCSARFGQERRQHRSDIITGHLAPARVLSKRHQAGTRLVGKAPRAQDGPLESSPGTYVRVRRALRTQISSEDRVSAHRRLAVDAHGRDDQEASNPGCLRRVREERGRGAVHTVLTVDAATRACTSREDGGVDALQMPGNVLHGRRLKIAYNRLGTRGKKVHRLLRPADYTRDLVTAPGEQPLQPQRKLTMSTSDNNTHGSHHSHAALARQGRPSRGGKGTRSSKTFAAPTTNWAWISTRGVGFRQPQ